MSIQNLSELIEKERASDLNQSFSYHSWVAPKHKFICMTVPKIACSTVKVALHQLNGHPEPADLGDIHLEGRRLAEFDTAAIAEMLTAPEWTKFCFVRNPYDRLLSAYKSKIGLLSDEYDWLQDEIRQAFAYPLRDGRPAGIVCFRDFVAYLRNAEDRASRDGHYNVQTNILMPHIINYDFVGRFENLVGDLSAILRQLGADDQTMTAASQVRNPTTKMHHAWAYDRSLADMVHQMYRLDFEHFGYDRDSWLFDCQPT
ncbi:MAG: hypothetical protein GKR89_35020 [Candidatus Latescibacteria bacterium]|nr:hypothetical protein [Candidatus Latescibacterota bacterium]